MAPKRRKIKNKDAKTEKLNSRAPQINNNKIQQRHKVQEVSAT